MHSRYYIEIGGLSGRLFFPEKYNSFDDSSNFISQQYVNLNFCYGFKVC